MAEGVTSKGSRVTLIWNIRVIPTNRGRGPAYTQSISTIIAADPRSDDRAARRLGVGRGACPAGALPVAAFSPTVLAKQLPTTRLPGQGGVTEPSRLRTSVQLDPWPVMNPGLVLSSGHGYRAAASSSTSIPRPGRSAASALPKISTPPPCKIRHI